MAETSDADSVADALYPAAMSNIASGNAIASVAALIGDAARAHILLALMDGRALTAGELAAHAGVTPQTASGHLARLTDAALVVAEKQGRHRYFRLAGEEIAQAVEALSLVVAVGPKRHHPVGPRDAALRNARTCYNHIAGRLGVALADSLQDRGFVNLADGAGMVTPEGVGFLAEFGVDLDTGGKSALCRTCLDWSERRHHFSGRLGTALLNRLLEVKWLARTPDTRALTITRTGEQGFASVFQLDWRSPSKMP